MHKRNVIAGGFAVAATVVLALGCSVRAVENAPPPKSGTSPAVMRTSLGCRGTISRRTRSIIASWLASRLSGGVSRT